MTDEMYPSSDTDPGMADKPTEPKGDESDQDTALLPKSILAGKDFKPGDEVVLKIVHMYEDEVEVAYASDKADSKEPDEDDSPFSDAKMKEMGVMK